ncbi:MAG TPA: GNAT family N-acetyltransferase [Micromonospora sp.]
MSSQQLHDQPALEQPFGCDAGPMELRTPRLLLRQWREDELAAFAALNADPEVMEHFPARLSRRESDALAARVMAHIGEHGWGLWAVEAAEEGSPDRGRFAGFTGLSVPSFEAHFTPAVEVGWRLARWAWGRGYASEAARAATAYGFGQLGLPEIVSFTAVSNARSQAVMRRIGMTHDPADDFDHPKLPERHPLRRHVLYRLPSEST